MSTTVWASVAAIGFGFVTYYFFLSGEKEKKREKAPRSTSVASIEIESIARTKSLASLAKESVTVSKVAKEVSSEQKVKVSVEKNTQTKTLVHAELNSTKKSVVSVIYEQESVNVEKPKEVVNVGAGLELDVGGLDLGSALDALQQQEPAVAKEPIPAPSLGKKRGARPSAMSLFAGNGEQPEEAVAIAVAEAPLVPGSGSAAAFLRAPDSVKFSFAAVEEANLKGLKKAKKVMTHGKGKSRFEMQDTHKCVVPFGGEEGSGLFLVFDGHAGKACATLCLTLFPAALERQGLGEGSREKQLINAFAETDKGLQKFEDEGATATAVWTWLSSDKKTRLLQCANVGDSSAFLVRDGRPVALTVDHKVTTASERARVLALGIELGEKATRIPGGLAVSRALGDHFLKSENSGLIADPFVSDLVHLTPADSHIILASDALWDMMTPQEAVDSLLQEGPGADADSIAKKLLAVACKSTDNATVIILKLE